HASTPRPMTVSLSSTHAPVQLRVADALPLHRAETDVRALLSGSLEVMRRQAKAAGIVLTVDADQNLPATMPFDGDKIAWATTVLVGNALRYVHQGTRLT